LEYQLLFIEQYDNKSADMLLNKNLSQGIFHF